MSSLYLSGDDSGVRTGTSTRSIQQAIEETQAWMADVDKRSSTSASSLSGHGSQHDGADLDLDLDSLFKRLDKYTAEMHEVEERLKRARSNSESSDGININHFSFESLGQRNKTTVPSPPRSSIGSSSQSGRQRISNERLDEQLWSPPGNGSKSSTSSRRSHSEYASFELPRIEQSPVSVDGRTKALAVLNENGLPTPTRERPDDPGVLVRDWKAWLGQELPLTQPNQERSSSRYSERAQSLRSSKKHGFVWRKSSPAPPLKDARRTASIQKPHLLEPGVEENASQEEDFDDYSSENGEPGPAITVSWTAPPRSSSRQVVSDKPLPPRTSSRRLMSNELVEEAESMPPQPVPRRRTTNSDGRSSIRNGGFWSGHGLGILNDDDAPPMPTLSASASNATLQSDPPPTPLTIGNPREDQIRRELETYSIHEGSDALEHQYKKRRPPTLNLLDSDDDMEDSAKILNSSETDYSSAQYEDDARSIQPSTHRRRKSILSIFQRKSPVEKLIDMYLDEEPETKPIPKKRATWSRKGSSVQEKMPTNPAIPPAFQQLHGKKTSL